MSKLLILHPYRETYTDIYSCLSQNHQYTILIDDSKSDSFETNKPTNVTLVTTQHYPEKRKETSQGILQQSHFDAIVALDEFDMVLAAELREQFHIKGQSVSQAKTFRDKDKMTQKVSELGFKIPHSRKISSYAELKNFFKQHGDIILKPLDGAGSVDTFHLKRETDLVSFHSDHFWKDKTVLVQEYIYADVYHIDGFVYQGNIIYCEPSQYIYNPLLIKKGISAAAVSLDHTSEQFNKLVDYASTLSHGLYPNGTFLFHLEVFYDGHEIIFLEIASRIGGARIRQNLQYKLNHNPLELLLKAICDDSLPTIPKTFPVTGWLLIAKKKGIIKQLPELTETIKKQYSIFDYTTYTQVGKQLNDAFHSADAIVGFSCYGSTFLETKKNLQGAEAWALENTRYEK